MAQEKTARDDGNSNAYVDSLHPALRLLHSLPGHRSNIRKLAISPNGEILASSSRDTRVCLWSLSSGKLIYEFHHGLPIRGIAWSPDGMILASSTYNTIYLWDIKTKRQLDVLKGGIDEINYIAWSPNGNILAASSVGGTICLWDINTKQILQKIKQVLSLSCIEWSPDGEAIALGSYEIILFNIKTGESEILPAIDSSSKIKLRDYTSYLTDIHELLDKGLITHDIKEEIQKTFMEKNFKEIYNSTIEDSYLLVS